MTFDHTIYFPQRIAERHVGGNTTYTRTLRDGLGERGFSTDIIPASANAIATMLLETRWSSARRQGVIAHFTADTGPLLKTPFPSVVTVHGIASRWVTGIRTPAQELVWRTRVRRAIKSTHRVITVSKTSADDIATVFNVDRSAIAVIPHGIDAAMFRRSAELSETLRFLENRRYILYVGNIEPRKNLIALANAYRRLNLDQQGIALVIAGKQAWNAKEIIAALDTTSGVVRLGFVSSEDRAALMQSCDLFAFPSRYEGFGFPVLEAMAAGARVVCSNNGALADIAGPAERFQGTTEDAIMEGIQSALNRGAITEFERAEALAWISRFTWESSISRHVEVYESLVCK